MERANPSTSMHDPTVTPAEWFRAKCPELHNVLHNLRAAAGGRHPEQVLYVFQDATRRLRHAGRYRDTVHAEVRLIAEIHDFTDALSDGGILSDEALFAGLVNRVGSALAPAPQINPTFVGLLDGLLTSSDSGWIEVLPSVEFEVWLREVTQALNQPSLAHACSREELAGACISLAARITGSAVNPRLVARMPGIDDWDSPFIRLPHLVDMMAEALVTQDTSEAVCKELHRLLEDCEAQVLDFREAKVKYGTTLELSSLSLRLTQQLRRLHQLVTIVEGNWDLADRSRSHLTHSLLLARARRRRVGDFFTEKLDLIAYLTVGHAARHGKKYVVHSTDDFARFLRKSLGGGALVAVFASLKLVLSKADLAPLPQGLLYGLNYAVCFALIYLMGATLATKQPAMTASKLAAALEGKVGSTSFPRLVQAVWRSQFVSFVGNVGGAAFFALLLGWAYFLFTDARFVSAQKGASLLESLHPTKSLSLYYAAIAGVLLSFSGFFSAWVDNQVVFHRVAARISAGSGIFGKLSPQLRQGLAKRVDKKTGGLSGNILLGFLLGSAGTVGYLVGIPFDIRHIAFASTHATLGLMEIPGGAGGGAMLSALVSVLLIGLVNFVVSFGLTLLVAIQSRRVKGVDWRPQVAALRSLVVRDPVRFFLPLPPRSEQATEVIEG